MTKSAEAEKGIDDDNETKFTSLKGKDKKYSVKFDGRTNQIRRIKILPTSPNSVTGVTVDVDGQKCIGVFNGGKVELTKPISNEDIDKLTAEPETDEEGNIIKKAAVINKFESKNAIDHTKSTYFALADSKNADDEDLPYWMATFKIPRAHVTVVNITTAPFDWN